MTIAFCVLSCLIAAGMFAGIFYINRFNRLSRRYIQFLFASASLLNLVNAILMVVQEESLAQFLYACCYALEDAFVVMLLYYAYHYSRTQNDHKLRKMTVLVMGLVDALLGLSSVFTEIGFVCERRQLPDGSVFCEVVPQFDVPIYPVHIFFIYVVLVLSLMVFVQKVVYANRMYREKYTGIIRGLVVLLVADILLKSVARPFRFTPLIFALMALCCAYFVFLYVPRGIVMKLLGLAVDDMQNGMVCFDQDGKCMYANEEGMRYFGANGNRKVLEIFYANWCAGKSGEELKEKVWQEEQTRDGEIYYYEMRFKLLLDDKGSTVGCYFLITDKTESVRELEMERYSASHDYLTDIYNREHFFERVEQVLKDEPKVKRLVACIDVKDFKVANDLFGEETGNRILKRIAGLMRRDAGEHTLYARLEADRFAMCMREEDLVEEEFEDYLEDLKRIVNTSVYRMHMHVGIYHITDPTVSVSVMCDKAFVAIQRIKDSYQQIISHYTEEMGQADQQEKVMIGEFDRAIAAGEFQMYLQPQVASDGYKVLGAEALVRWDHPVRGILSPGVFVPIFEKSGYITRLDNYMWELACRQLRYWKDQGFDDLHISVNISPMDFYLLNLYETFTALVESYDIDPSRLKLEITETALMEDIAKHLAMLAKLRNYGFQVEIDDFGSGYSSLNTLQDIEVDVLKLDMGFLRKTENQERSRVIMHAVIDMSKKLGLTVVTEGVETKEQIEYLTEAGCDIFQGYYFAKPMPVSAFEERYLTDQRTAVAAKEN